MLSALMLPQVPWSCRFETTRLTVVWEASVYSSIMIVKFCKIVRPEVTWFAIMFCCIMQRVFVLSQHKWSGCFVLTLVTKYHVFFMKFSMAVHFRSMLRGKVTIFAHSGRIFLFMDSSYVRLQDMLWNEFIFTQLATYLFNIVLFSFVNFQLF